MAARAARAACSATCLPGTRVPTSTHTLAPAPAPASIIMVLKPNPTPSSTQTIPSLNLRSIPPPPSTMPRCWILGAMEGKRKSLNGLHARRKSRSCTTLRRHSFHALSHAQAPTQLLPLPPLQAILNPLLPVALLSWPYHTCLFLHHTVPLAPSHWARESVLARAPAPLPTLIPTTPLPSREERPHPAPDCSPRHCTFTLLPVGVQVQQRQQRAQLATATPTLLFMAIAGMSRRRPLQLDYCPPTLKHDLIWFVTQVTITPTACTPLICAPVV